MIINIRGTGGSGKSYVVRTLMDRFNAQPILDAREKILGYEMDIIKTFVYGPYKADSGGVDNLSKEVRSQDCIEEEEVRSRSRDYHVIFEGLLVSGIYGRWRNFAKTVPDFRWVFLNTPLEQCIENTRVRRVKASPDFSLKATEDKYRSVRALYHKTRYDRLNSYDVSSDEAVALIAGWLTTQ
jgi:cytidylate kinase